MLLGIDVGNNSIVRAEATRNPLGQESNVCCLAST